MFKRAILATLKRFGYTLLRSDWFERQKAIAAAEIAATSDSANDAIERSRATKDDAIPAMIVPNVSGTSDSTRPLFPIAQEQEGWADGRPPVAEILARIESSAAFTQSVVPYFADYPRSSLISSRSRAYLYSFVRALRPSSVVEIGTLFAGTTEVVARALWENGSGVLDTIDPFGADRAPLIIATWPLALRRITHFHPIDSMSFFARSADMGRFFDIVLVDGNHDLEFALFDIQMSARLISPRGLIFVDNAEQRGPFVAVQRFMRANPEWSLLGTSYDTDRPFAIDGRASLPETVLIVLQAPLDTIVGAEPVSWGQTHIAASVVDGVRFDFSRSSQSGTLHYKAILRAFSGDARRIEEFTSIGQIGVDVGADTFEQSHKFAVPLNSEFPKIFSDCHHTFEIELAWRSGDGGPLRLSRPPLPLLNTHGMHSELPGNPAEKNA
jgi:predicted O-methyltransferase YrrM